MSNRFKNTYDCSHHTCKILEYAELAIKLLNKGQLEKATEVSKNALAIVQEMSDEKQKFVY